VLYDWRYFACPSVGIYGIVRQHAYINGDIDGIKRIKLTTGGFNPCTEIVTMEEYEQLKEKGMVVGHTLLRK